MNPSRAVQECSFTTHDGVALFYRHWPARTPSPRGCVVLLHRGHEHSGRMAHVVEELGLPDFDFFAWDARGHGRSPGPRGHSPGFGHSVRDVQTFIDHIGVTHGFAPEQIAVIAQSVGAVLAATWAHDYAPRIRALVLASPAFSIKLYVPFALQGLRLLRAVRGNFFVNSYVKSRLLTHDRARQVSYDADPLIARSISVDMLLGLHEAAQRVVADAQAIVVPTQLLISGSDWVVRRRPQEAFFERLGAPVKEMHLLPGFHHDTLGEADRARALDKARGFIERLFESGPVPVRADLRDADRRGPTHEEARALARALPAWHPRAWYWALVRLNLRLGGRLSEGIRLGHQTGFDSGSSLDYVYRDTASGCGPLGRAIDRQYLDAIGWRGIRQRKRHLEELLRRATQLLHRDGRPVRVLDIAAGHGRYVLEALVDSEPRPQSVLLRDFSELNVREGQRLIREKGLQDVARFVAGDGFDRASVAAATPHPTVGIVSGLYELFADNEPVQRSLAGLADAIAPGGYLLYTGQPWHPQLEMIARALTSHRGGQAWVMRRRTQAELDQLVEAAGFRKLEQRIDEWGIFTVSLARRVSA